MPAFSAFNGGFYQALSPTFAADTAVNVYLETRSVPGSAKTSTLIGTPGQLLEGTVPSSGMRGEFAQDGRAWFVCGSTLYERVSAGSYAVVGNVGTDGLPVSFASNGKGGDQLALSSAGNVYVLNLNTNALTMAVLPFTGAVMLAFIDGYVLALQKDSPIVWFSALENALSWDALDFFARSGTSDNIVGIAVTKDRVWCLGSKTATLFYDSGDTDTPFVPYPGTTMQIGLVSPWLMGVYADQVFWVSVSSRGSRRVVMAMDAVPQPISTPPIDLWLQNCPTLAGAEMLIYEQDSHVFVNITAPDSPDDIQTYSFDAAENMWAARAGWDAVRGVYTRWPVRGVMGIDGAVIVGDYRNGNIYELRLTTYTDNGGIIRRERACPYVSDENQWLFIDSFELGAQVGVGLSTGQGVAPVANLELSRDAGQTWVNTGTATLGAMGGYLARAIWRRLGRSRGDRLVFRVTQTDPVKTAWTGAWIRAQAGTGQL
jgi:hypothetical protein